MPRRSSTLPLNGTPDAENPEWTREDFARAIRLSDFERVMKKTGVRASRARPASAATLRRRVVALEGLCADFYQLLGHANAPVRYLDAAVAAACGWPLPKTPLKSLTKPEKLALGKESASRG